MTISFRCRIGWHPWPRWGEPYEGSIVREVASAGVIISRQERPTMMQERTCPGCGKAAWRRV